MARITVDELKVIITADVKELDKALSKSGKTVKDYVKELKDTSKNTEAVGEKTEGLSDGLGSMADGLLKGITGLGGLSLGAVAAGAAVAKLTLEIGRVGYEAYTQFNQLNDYMAATGTQSKAVMGLFTSGVKGMAVDYKQAALAVSSVTERLNIDVASLNKQGRESWAMLGGKLAKLAEDSGSDVSAMASSFTTVEQRWASDGLDFAKTADIIYTAAKKANTAPGMMADAIADASPTFQRFGYSLGETAGIVARFMEQKLDPGAFVGLLKRNISEFGDDAESARIELTRLIGTVTQLDKEGRYGAIDSLLATYGLSEAQAETLRLAARSGVFKGGAYEGSAVYKMPEPDIENWGDLWQSLANDFALGMTKVFQKAFEAIIQSPGTPFDLGEIADLEYQAKNYAPGATYRDVMRDNPEVYDTWWNDILTQKQRQDYSLLGVPSSYTAQEIYRQVIEVMKKQKSQKNSLLPYDMENPQLVTGSLTGGLSKFVEEPQTVAAMQLPGVDMGMRVASAGWATDFGGYGIGFGTKQTEQASKDELLISDRTTQALITDSKLVLAHRLEDYGTWRRSSEATFGAVTAVSREAAEASAQSFYTLRTTFGDLNFDITKMSKSLEEWGINVPTLFDYIVTGVKRIGNEMLESTGLDETWDYIVGWATDIKSTIDGLGLELGTFWDMFVDKTKLSVEEAAEALKGFNEDALGKLKETVGTVVMAIGEMWATGTGNWKQLWNETFKSLLSILINWGVKTILTLAATEEGIATINAIIKAVTGDWAGFGAAMAGLAIVAAGTAGWIAAIKAIGNSLPDGTEEEEKDPDWLKPDQGFNQPGTPEGSGPGASSIQTSERPNVVVHIHNPNYMGQFSDADAAAFGQAFGEALIVRGVMPQPIG